MLRRIEIEKAENGFKIDVWKDESEDEVIKLVKEHLGDK